MPEPIHEYLPANTRERIQNLLWENHMTQAQLAERLSISESSLNRYMSGQTEKLSTENLVTMAKVFQVSTDFLLGLTDIPFTTNYDIERLGLSVKAAEKLLRRKVDPALVSQLIELQAFNTLILQLGAAQRGTYDAGYDYMRQMVAAAGDLLTEHVRENPNDRKAAKNAVEDIRALSLSMVPRQMEMNGIEEAMRQIVAEFKKGSEGYLKETQKLTSEIMRNIISTLRTQMNHPTKLRGITPEMMADSVLSCLGQTELTAEQTATLRTALLPLFTKPEDLAEQLKLSDGSIHGKENEN